MAQLPHGIHTLDIGATTPREIINAALEQLDQNRITAGPISSRPAAGVAGRFWFATDTGATGLSYDNGEEWVE